MMSSSRAAYVQVLQKCLPNGHSDNIGYNLPRPRVGRKWYILRVFRIFEYILITKIPYSYSIPFLLFSFEPIKFSGAKKSWTSSADDRAPSRRRSLNHILAGVCKRNLYNTIWRALVFYRLPRGLGRYLKSPLGYTFWQIFGKQFLDTIILDLFSGAHTGES